MWAQAVNLSTEPAPAQDHLTLPAQHKMTTSERAIAASMAARNPVLVLSHASAASLSRAKPLIRAASGDTTVVVRFGVRVPYLSDDQNRP